MTVRPLPGLLIMSNTWAALPGAPVRVEHLSKHFGPGYGRVTARVFLCGADPPG